MVHSYEPPLVVDGSSASMPFMAGLPEVPTPPSTKDLPRKNRRFNGVELKIGQPFERRHEGSHRNIINYDVFYWFMLFSTLDGSCYFFSGFMFVRYQHSSNISNTVSRPTTTTIIWRICSLCRNFVDDIHLPASTKRFATNKSSVTLGRFMFGQIRLDNGLGLGMSRGCLHQ